MLISDCQLYEYSAELNIPLPRTGISTRHGIYVRLIMRDGSDGYGEISPLPGFSIENLDEAAEQAIGVARRITGMPLSEEILEKSSPDPEGLFSSVACGFELAIWNLLRFGVRPDAHAGVGAAFQSSFYRIPPRRTRINICALLSGSSDEVEDQAFRRVRQGYTSFKLKVGDTDPDRDVLLIRNVAKLIGPGAGLRLDANRAWTTEEALYVLNETDDLEFEYIEEPLSEPSEYRVLVENMAVPIALDESTDDLLRQHGSTDTWTFRNVPWLKVLVLKPMIRGGLRESIEIATMAHLHGIESVVSSSFESSTGFDGLLSLASILPGRGLAAGLDTLHYFNSESGTNDAPTMETTEVNNRLPDVSFSCNRIF